MANYLNHLGLDFLAETEEEMRNLWGCIAQEGKAISGYYSFPYINHHFGNAQLILRVIRKGEKSFEAVGMDTHSSGNCIWELCFTGANIARKDADILERRCIVRRRHGSGGIAVVNIVNADVLPSFAEGEPVRLQMIAFPSRIEYFKDEDAYAAAQPKGSDGEEWLLADGAVIPSGLLYNRNPESDAFDSDDDLDDITLVRGTVKGLYYGTVAFGEEKHDAYLRCIVGTEFGDLEIVHTIGEVAEAQHGDIRVGATVSAVVTLSGDAAIYEYEQGIILDEDHDLAILRATFAGADPERLRRVFAEDAVYSAEYNDKTYTGRDAILERLKGVTENADVRYYAHSAVITSVDEGDEPLPYGAGKRCIVIAPGEEDNYDTVAFADIDEEGRISRLTTSISGRYHFHIEENG